MAPSLRNHLLYHGKRFVHWQLISYFRLKKENVSLQRGNHRCPDRPLLLQTVADQPGHRTLAAAAVQSGVVQHCGVIQGAYSFLLFTLQL